MSEEAKNVILEATEKIEHVESKVDSIVDRTLDLVGNHPWEKWLAVANKYVSMFLPVIIALSGILACITGFVMAIKFDAKFTTAINNLWILLPTLFALHLAPKTLALTRSFVEKGSTESIRPEFLYILKVVLGLGGFLAGIYLLLQFSKETLFPAIIVLVIATIFTIVCTRPGIVGIKADYPANVVEEVFGIFLMPFKIVLSLLTVITGLASVGGLVYGIVMMFESGFAATAVLSGVAVLPFLLPLAAYLMMLLAMFIVDFCRALAKIPTKLDEVKDELKK